MTGPSLTTPAAPPVIRLTPAAPPRPTAPARGAAFAKPPEGDGGSRVLTYLRLHWLTILFLGSLIGAGLAYVAWTLVPPKFESYALFQVASAPVHVTADPNRGRTDFNTYLKTTAGLFKQEFVYTGALRELRNNPTIAAQKDPMRFLNDELSVETKEGSEIIRLSMRGVNPDDVRAIVNAMKDSYIEQVVEREHKVKAAQKADLEKQKTELDRLINQKIRPGADGVPGALKPTESGFGQPKPKDGDPVPVPVDDHIRRAAFPKLLDRAMKLREELPDYDASVDRLKVGIAATKVALQKLLDEPPAADAVELAKKDEAYLKAKSAADARQAEYESRSATVRNPNSDAMTELRRTAEAARTEAAEILASKAKKVEVERRKPLFDKMAQELTMAELGIQEWVKKKERTVAELARLDKEIRETPAPLAAPVYVPPAAAPKPPVADPALTDIGTHDDMLRRVTLQLLATDLELKGPKRVTVLQPASAPQLADGKKQLLATAFAGLLGFGLVAGVVLLAETRARKVSSLGELKGTSPTPVVGVVPWMPNADTARDPLKRADVNEAIDKLRAYVVQTWLSKGAGTVTVTSALGDEGKAFTAFGLASSLAQAGYKVLLADFDLRNPSLHPFAGVPNGGGVCELLRGEADFRKTIQILPNGLHFLAAGKWSDEARQAAVGGRLEALLNRLKEPFDCVVLHGHALLTVAESVEVARRSEVVLLCALYRDTRGPMLKRAAERVASMEIPFAGIVYLGATPTEALC